ncbi:MAG: TlpA disulfide reductase family protein [Candidatus Eisenbacteria bacterium]
MRRLLLPLLAIVLLTSLVGPPGEAVAIPPRPAPAMQLTDLRGRAVDWKRFEGKVVLVDFWATWCAPCRLAMPEMQVLHDRYAARGFTVLGISVDQQGPANVERFVTSRKLTYPIAIDNPRDPVALRFGVRALPTAFLVDGKGRIVVRWVGSPDKKDLERHLKRMLPTG